jgi:hypothetical protein
VVGLHDGVLLIVAEWVANRNTSSDPNTIQFAHQFKATERVAKWVNVTVP